MQSRIFVRATLVALTVSLVGLGAPVATAGTIGSSLTDRAMRDFNWGGLFVYNLVLPDAGSHVAEWAFYGGVQANGQGTTGAGNAITPLLFERVGASQAFSILGIGTTRINDASGIQRSAFGLVGGSDIVGPNTYFGWRDGTIDGGAINDGSVELDYTGGPGLFYFPTNAPFPMPGLITAGDVHAFAFAPDRTYSVEVTTVPEPATMTLLGLGLAGVVRAARRRK